MNTNRKNLKGGKKEKAIDFPPVEDLEAVIARNTPTPPEIVAGLFRAGEKVVLGGASKSFKSWAALDLALSVASGVPWWGRRTTQGRVLVCNLELPAWCIRRRILDIAQARDVSTDEGRMFIWTLRGLCLNPGEFLDGFEKCAPDNLAAIIVDPAYKLLGDLDENSAGDIAKLLSIFDVIAARTGAAVIIPCHFAKGNASGKEAADRISGSGVFARDPDTVLTMTKHESDGAFSVEASIRTLPPVNPFCIRWSHPVFTTDESLDPARLRKARGRTAEFDLSSILGPMTPAPMSVADWKEAALNMNGVKEATFFRLKKEAIKCGRVVEVRGTPGAEGKRLFHRVQ